MPRRGEWRRIHPYVCFLVLITLMLSPVGADRLSQDQIERLRSEAIASRSDAFLVWQDGVLLVDYSKPDSPEFIESMSVTKSIVALAIGKLLTEGKLSSVDQPVSDFYPEWKQGLKRKITIRHLLSHTSGLQNVSHTREEIYPAPDFVQLALAADLTSEPGEEFSYNNKAVNLLSGLAEKCSGQRLDEYVADHLFNELGIKRCEWLRDDSGNPHAMSGIQIAPKDLLKIGQLVLNRGSWDGRRVLSSEWLDEALSAQGSPLCGFLWWRIPKKSRFVIDSQSVQKFAQQSGLPETSEAATALIGVYSQQEQLRSAVRKAFPEKLEDPEFVQALDRYLIKTEVEEVLGYSANGYLGQFLIVVPERKLIVVRMISASVDYDPETDSFSHLQETLRSILAP